MEVKISLIIQGKKAAKDPEGETVKRDLMQRHGFQMVEEVRSAKLLKITLEAESKEKAREIVEKMVNELRLANPVAQDYEIRIEQ